MEITRADRVRMERAHVRAWPALRSASIDGWLWRCSGGGSQRANSVSTIDFHGTDPDAAIAAAEVRYQALGRPAGFHTFEETSPPELADLLRGRGYRQNDPTVTMFKRAGDIDLGADIDTREDAWDAWRSLYLAGITESRRAVNTLILEQIPAPRAFFGCRDGVGLASTALCVAGLGCAVIECVMTRPDARRMGAARSVLRAVEHWAARQGVDWIGLQVVATNAPAIRLYDQLGFTAGATNRFWTLA